VEPVQPIKKEEMGRADSPGRSRVRAKETRLMLRSHWSVPIALVLTTAGLARGQALQTDAPPGAWKDRFVAVQEVGKPPLRCKLLKTWYEPDGTRAYQVQVVETREMISIFESSSADETAPVSSKGKAVASRIVHWGSAKQPPSGTPQAPADAIVLGMPIREPARLNPGETVLRPEPSTPYTAKAPAGGWAPAYARESQPKTLQQPSQPVVQNAKVPTPAANVASADQKKAPTTAPTTPPRWATAVTSQADTVKPETVKPQPSPVATTAPAAAKLVASPVVSTTVPPAKPVASPVVTAPLPSAKPVASPVVNVPAPAPKPLPSLTETPTVSTWSPILAPTATSPYAPVTAVKSSASAPASVSTAAAAPTATAPSTTTPAPAATALSIAITAPAATASSTTATAANKSDVPDWHQSWGKVDQPKSSLLTSAAPPAPVLAPRAVDPLQTPENYSKVSIDERIDHKFREKFNKEAVEAASAAKAKPASDATASSTSSDVKPSNAATRSGTALDMTAGTTSTTVVDTSAHASTTTALQALAPPPGTGLLNSVSPPPANPVVTVPPLSAPSMPTPPPLSAPSMPAPPLVTPPPPSVSTTQTRAVPPPPPAPLPPPPPVPATAVRPPSFVTAASVAASDETGNAFSGPAGVPAKSNASVDPNGPPPVSRMPGYTPLPGTGSSFSQIPPAPPVIAAAPTAGVVAAGYPVVAPAPAVLPPISAPTAADAGLSPRELLMTLRTSLYPSQREWAADRLTSSDWRTQPQVIDGLVAAARSDPAPLVRAGCLRALARMHATCEPSLAVASELKGDADTRVRQEAEQTLKVLQTNAPRRVSD
jgi:hypothetical protein